MIVAIIGADGSGKSTVAEDLTAALRKKNFSSVFIKDFEEYFIIKYFLLPFRNLRKNAVNKFYVEAKQKPGILVRYLWPLIVYFDQICLYLFLNLFRKNDIIVSDRYPYSMAVSWTYYGMGSVFTNTLFECFPRPEICVVLDASPRTLMKRKEYQKVGRGSSYNIGFFQRHKELYDALASRKKLLKVDSEKGIKEVVNCLIDIVEKELR